MAYLARSFDIHSFRTPHKNSEVELSARNVKNRNPKMQIELLTLFGDEKPTITFDDVPESLKKDTNVGQYIAQLMAQLLTNEILAYFLKLHVFDYVINNKVGKNNAETDLFARQLLIELEPVKYGGPTDRIFAREMICANLIFHHALTCYQECLEDLKNYEKVSKSGLKKKMRECVLYWSLMPLFKNDNTYQSMSYINVTRGLCESEIDFLKFAKDKMKALKFHLTRVV